ncbi:hypothetical protein [Chelativorans alearense]|uniref:hypothetical protein n=1 Tax=Chelativorans alearense TaxID=2681495 RepID=UPI0013D790D3|nr:hypothetical protein [Chelativorans alearense]
MSRRRDTLTLELFDWQPPQVAVGFAKDQLPGNRLASRISRAVALALKDCSLSRAEVAARMSDELGYPVSESMLDAYASEAKEGHKITLERFIALVEATGCHDLLGFVAELYGYVVVPERYASLIELHLLDEHEREVQRRKQAAEARWRAGR